VKGGLRKAKLKTLSIVLIAAMIALVTTAFIAPLALAEEETNVTNESSEQTLVIAPGTTETEEELGLNESVSEGKIFWKQLGLWFTFNQEKKARIELEIARLRLIQAKIAAKNNDTEALEKALEAHERIMNRVQERLKAIEYVTNKNVSAPVARLVALETAIAVHERRIEFLNNLLATANLTQAQRERIETRLSHVENVTAKLIELSEEKKDRLVTRIMATTNMTEEQAKAVIEAREEAIEGKIEKVRERIRERVVERVSNLKAENESEED